MCFYVSVCACICEASFQTNYYLRKNVYRHFIFLHLLRPNSVEVYFAFYHFRTRNWVNRIDLTFFPEIASQVPNIEISIYMYVYVCLYVRMYVYIFIYKLLYKCIYIFARVYIKSPMRCEEISDLFLLFFTANDNTTYMLTYNNDKESYWFEIKR